MYQDSKVVARAEGYVSPSLELSLVRTEKGFCQSFGHEAYTEDEEISLTY